MRVEDESNRYFFMSSADRWTRVVYFIICQSSRHERWLSDSCVISRSLCIFCVIVAPTATTFLEETICHPKIRTTVI